MTDFHTFFFWYTWLTLPVAIVFFGYIVRQYIATRRTRPNIPKENIVYQEWFASGNSQKNFLTKIGGAGNCLRLVVTRDLLWVTTWFPFTLIAPVYDLVHVIPLRCLSSVQPVRRFLTDGLLLSYADDAGRSHSLRLIPKDRERFLAALQLNADCSKATGPASPPTLANGIGPSLDQRPNANPSLGVYVKKYARHIVPAWLFPVYFIAFGMVCEHFKVRAVGFWFVLLVAPVFIGTFWWAQVAPIPYWKRTFLTMVVPFLIFAGIAVLLAVFSMMTGVKSL